MTVTTQNLQQLRSLK